MTIVRTDLGEIEGVERDGIHRFAGIPFAMPPVGRRRFQRPAPVEPWSGRLDARDFRATSPQFETPLTAMLGGAVEPTSEDCLFANVFTPGCDDAGRPVMVWIHGGGFVMGSGSSPMYDGGPLARRGDVVVVTINYRLGALGFLSVDDLGIGDGSANAGILDQVLALRWVRDHIASFGGDPGNVTIFGESAGAMSVGTLLGMPAAQGLFHRAVLQSGAAHNSSTPKAAIEVRDDFMSRLPGGIESLLTATDLEIVAAQGDLFIDALARFDQQLEGGAIPSLLPYQPVHDEVDLPHRPVDAVRSGSVNHIPLLIGTNRDEWKLFALLNQMPIDESDLHRRLNGLMGDSDAAVAVYRERFPEASPVELFGAAVTDYVFRQPAIRLAETQSAAGGDSFMYLFSWASPALGGVLGSCHALEVPFVFDKLDGLGMLLGDDLPRTLFDSMQDSWLAFARTGDPSNETVGEWPVYDEAERSTMRLDLVPEVLSDPESDSRALWDGVV